MAGHSIVVDTVTKKYRRLAHAHRYLTLKSAILNANLFSMLSDDEVFTALDGVDLTVERGETFGVIGGNGAGKSTLLKIIAGTTKPTSGSVEVEGKISALIELGAGFHPEITGRENVFINGIMLGLSREQIHERFDEIVRFAELEDFIDAPVKTYSSGMYMRLGFSVAIHVDPDVLLIDEVLAVGDEAFVHKCLDKIAEFKRRDKTILLVTHGLESVRRLCDRAMWLKDGRVQLVGDPPRVVDTYLGWVAEKEEEELADRHARQLAAGGTAAASGSAPQVPAAPGTGGTSGSGAAPGPAAERAAGAEERGTSAADPRVRAADPGPEAAVQPAEGSGKAHREEAPYETGRWGSQDVVIDEVRLLDRHGDQKYVFACGEPMTIEMTVSAREEVDDFVFGVGIFNPGGVCCYGTNTDIERFEPERLSGRATVRVHVPALELVAGTYHLDLAVHRRDGFAYDYQRGLCTFRTTSKTGEVGVARLPHRWEVEGELAWERVGDREDGDSPGS